MSAEWDALRLLRVGRGPVGTCSVDHMVNLEMSFLFRLPPHLQKEAQEYLVTCSCPDYLQKAEKRLMEEVERVKNYLDPMTEVKITRAVETELIYNQAGRVNDNRGKAVGYFESFC